MLSMVKKQKVKLDRIAKNQKKILIVIGIITLLKLILIPNIEKSQPGSYSGAWLGSDGETYLAAAEALIKDGIFSKSNLLIYFAPGYSIFLAALHLLTGKMLFLFTSVIQTLLYSYASYFLGQQLLKTKLNKITLPTILIFLLNPTLSLSSLVIGYENLIASACMLALGLLILDLKSEGLKTINVYMLITAALFGFTIWLSPRMVLPGFLFLLVWIYLKNGFKKNFLASLIVIFVFLGFQSSIVLRNAIATGNIVSQSSLGTLAIMGAGPNATGKYTDTDTGIVCDVTGLSAGGSSNKKLLCAANWYANNPTQGLLLLWKKSYYLWSPWFGPLYGGTMARNPYLFVHPVKLNITTQSQLDFVMGTPGQIISWIWILGGWWLLILGFRELLKSTRVERAIGVAAMLVILSSWFTVLIVEGDNRYRIPFMPLSILLQLVGYHSLRKVK
jgi:hypothetical protein